MTERSEGIFFPLQAQNFSNECFGSPTPLKPPTSILTNGQSYNHSLQMAYCKGLCWGQRKKRCYVSSLISVWLCIAICTILCAHLIIISKCRGMKLSAIKVKKWESVSVYLCNSRCRNQPPISPSKMHGSQIPTWFSPDFPSVLGLLYFQLSARSFLSAHPFAIFLKS